MKRGKVEIPRTAYFDGYSNEQAARFEGTRQWLGYRQVDINLSGISDKNLVDYVLEKGMLISKPKKILIPSQVSERYHLDGLFFKIYNEQWGRPPGMCRAVASGRLSQELLYSESYTEIMQEVKKRELLAKVGSLEKKRKADWKKGIGYAADFSDQVNFPEEERIFDSLKALRESEEYARKHPSHIIISAPGS
jgi:hypothetical protein